MAERGLKPCGGRRIDVLQTVRCKRGDIEGQAGERKNFTVRCATMSGLYVGKVWVSEMRPGQTRSYKELFPDRLGGEGIHIKGMCGNGWWTGAQGQGREGQFENPRPGDHSPLSHRSLQSTCRPSAFGAPPPYPTTLLTTPLPSLPPPLLLPPPPPPPPLLLLYHHYHYCCHLDLPKIQFGFYPSKKLYNGSDARGQNPIPGKLNNLKHIIICMMYDSIQYRQRHENQVISVTNENRVGRFEAYL